MIELLSHPDIPCFSQMQDVLTSLLGKRENLGFIDVDETVDTSEIHHYITKISDQFDTMVVLGIGGSALGTRAVFEALKGKYHNQKQAVKKLYILDNIDPESITDVEEQLDLSKTLFCIISKSGTTVEIHALTTYFMNLMKSHTVNWKEHFCYVLWENYSQKVEIQKHFQTFCLADNIGGRFSVFTPVGLLPLAFAGVDIDALLTGVKHAKQRFLSEDTQQNTALRLALLQHYFYEKEGKNICVLFPYSSRLGGIGAWYTQLLSESIGKDSIGITPVTAVGVTDQHSELQLFQDGPRDKFFMSLQIAEHAKNPLIDAENHFGFAELLEIERYGTLTSLQNDGVPLAALQIDDISESSLAELLYMFEFQIAYLWEFFGINAFDQPWVEKSKILIKQKLAQDFPNLDLAVKSQEYILL